MNQGFPYPGQYFASSQEQEPRQGFPNLPGKPPAERVTPEPASRFPDLPGVKRAPVNSPRRPRPTRSERHQPQQETESFPPPQVHREPLPTPQSHSALSQEMNQQPTHALRRATATPRVGAAHDLREGDPDLNQMLTRMAHMGASDLHLTAGARPMVRLRGELTPLDDSAKLMPDSLQRVIFGMLTQKQREKFEENWELDFSYSVPGQSRYRVNLYYQRESVGAAFRLIPYEIKSLESLGIPPTVGEFSSLPRGMVLVTGPTGSGKSTTLAALVDLCNDTRAEHIMTVEDPIEFLHSHKKALVNQREVGSDTQSFPQALKHVLRQDPDIILVGELRDLDTISVALTAAETGHLVFATLHTQDAPQTIDRIIDVFPSAQQAQVRTQLAGAIQGVVSQTLCKTADGRGRVVATEVMNATPAIRNLIREGKTHQIYSALQSGSNSGMHSMDQHLAQLVRSGDITYEHGLEKCHHEEDFKRLSGRVGGAQ